MKCLKNESTEERIKAAAAKVFMEKGFDGTTTREIAKEADLNCALMNYYFRSKEKLFTSVFTEMFGLFFQGLTDILSKPLSLKEKVLALIDHDFEMFKEHSNLSNFVLNEINRNPDRLIDLTQNGILSHHKIFQAQFEDAIKSGEVRDIDFKHLLIMISSNVQFIFLSKRMTLKVHNMDEAEFEKLLSDHMQVVKDMIIEYLFIKK